MTTQTDNTPIYNCNEEQCYARLDAALAIIESTDRYDINNKIARRVVQLVKERLYVLTVGETTQQTIDRQG